MTVIHPLLLTNDRSQSIKTILTALIQRSDSYSYQERKKACLYINMADETAKFGDKLDNEYGEPHPQDLHIDYFFLILGSEIIDKLNEIIDTLKTLGDWVNFKEEWHGILRSKFPKISPNETERQREERLNQIQKQLLARYADPNNPSQIIVSRACRYTEGVVRGKLSLTTPEIENVLTSQHLDYFYILITGRIPVKVDMDVPFMLAQYPGDWKAVEPQATWPLMFIGYFPKMKPFETEREREFRLNQEVREPLKVAMVCLLIQQLQAQGITPPKKLVSIVITRACTYTNM